MNLRRNLAEAHLYQNREQLSSRTFPAYFRFAFKVAFQAS